MVCACAPRSPKISRLRSPVIAPTHRDPPRANDSDQGAEPIRESARNWSRRRRAATSPPGALVVEQVKERGLVGRCDQQVARRD
jgi:hypothetical protein